MTWSNILRPSAAIRAMWTGSASGNGGSKQRSDLIKLTSMLLGNSVFSLGLNIGLCVMLVITLSLLSSVSPLVRTFGIAITAVAGSIAAFKLYRVFHDCRTLCRPSL